MAEAIGRKEDCPCKFVETVKVKDTFQGKTVWEGDVWVFALERTPKQTVYSWVDPDENLLVTVLERPPVDSALAAVRAYIVSKIKAQAES